MSLDETYVSLKFSKLSSLYTKGCYNTISVDAKLVLLIIQKVLS